MGCSSWHCEVLQCYYELYTDRSLDCVIFKMQVQKFAIKQLPCRTEKSVSLWVNALARKCNSPVTEEKEMVLTEFASQFHRLLSNLSELCSPFRVNYLQSNRDSNRNYYLSLHKNFIQKEPGVISKILKSSLHGFEPNFFFFLSLSPTLHSVMGGTNCLKLCPYSLVTTDQCNC